MVFNAKTVLSASKSMWNIIIIQVHGEVAFYIKIEILLVLLL